MYQGLSTVRFAFWFLLFNIALPGLPDMSTIPDLQILQKIKNREVEGYRLLFMQYYKPLCIQATLLLNNAEAAEDVVQEVLIYLWKQERFAYIGSSLGGYLGVSVKNACLQYLEKERRQQTRLDDYAAFAALPEIADPEELERRYRHMEAAINQLPEQCSTIFRLVHLQNKKYLEAAEEVGVSVNTVKTQLKIAMQKLREAVKENK